MDQNHRLTGTERYVVKPHAVEIREVVLEISLCHGK
jgi:hypothetical protein